MFRVFTAITVLCLFSIFPQAVFAEGISGQEQTLEPGGERDAASARPVDARSGLIAPTRDESQDQADHLYVSNYAALAELGIEVPRAWLTEGISDQGGVMDPAEEAPAPSEPLLGPCDVLIAPALQWGIYFPDNLFMSKLSALLPGSTIDYHDAAANVPTTLQLSNYDLVITFVEENFADRIEMGDNLAWYVENGGKLILGQFNYHTEGQGDWLDGRIMDEYCPVTIGENRFSGDYSGDGTDCIFSGVSAFHVLPYSNIDGLVGSAGSDGTWVDGATMAGYRLDRSVYYITGHFAGYLSADADEDAWAQLTANICNCAPDPLLGACCDPFAGTCTDNTLPANCQPPLQWTYDTACASLDPSCGNPGACCDDSGGGCAQEFERNCAGRFEAGAACSPDPFNPGCGDTDTCKILYAPTNDDDPALRARISDITASAVDYYDPRLATPTLAQLQQYDTVVTWVNGYYDDAIAMGDVLADYVESGGRVVLGLWSAPGANNAAYLEGRLMAQYCPVTILGLDWGGTTYADDGVDCLHDDVAYYSPRIWDKIREVAPDAWVDGTYLNNDGEQYPAIVYRHDRKVIYISGFEGGLYGPGDWEKVIASTCTCPPVDLYGACCDAATGTCNDGVLPTDCMPPLQWSHDVLCADLDPACGNPGACCDYTTELCTWENEQDCSNGRFRPGQTCASLPFDPLCGDYDPCTHSITMWDDGGDGWTWPWGSEDPYIYGGYLDVYVGGFPVLTGVTLADGYGPETVYFQAEAGEEITTVWTPPEHGRNEPSYCIAGLDGEYIACDGLGGLWPAGGTTYGDCTTVACGNGICQNVTGGETCVNCSSDCGVCACISQAYQPSGSQYYSDLDCDACGGNIQIVADNFRVYQTATVEGVRFWGGYSPDGLPLPDQFTLRFLADDGGAPGLPGAEIASYGPLAGTRTALGGGEFEWVIDVNETLPPGDYWLEIYNDTSSSTQTWFWFEGDLDPVSGLTAGTYSYEFSMPEVWQYTAVFDGLGFELICPHPNAVYDSHGLIADTCSVGGPGDGDGAWDDGEDVQFSVTIHSDGGDPLSGISATLTPLTLGVTMLDDTATYPDLAGDETGISDAPHFSAALPAGLMCGSMVEFRIDITSNEGSWSDTFQQEVGVDSPILITLLDEDFEGSWGEFGDNPPAGWTIEDYGDAGDGWNWNDWHNWDKGAPYGAVAQANGAPAENQDEWLVSPSFDIPTGYASVDLEFDHHFENATAEFGYVDYTSTQNPGWNNLITYDADTADMAHETISLLSYEGDTNAQIRFRYIGGNGSFWQVDNVQVSGSQANCTVNPCSVCTVPGASNIDSIVDSDPCALSGVVISYTTGSPATRHDLYRDGGLAVTGFVSGSTYNPPDSGTYDYMIRAINGDDTCFTDSAPLAGTDAENPCLPPAEPSASGSSYPLQVVSTGNNSIVVELITDATAYNFYADPIGSWYSPTNAEGTVCTITTWTDNLDGTITLDVTVPDNSWVTVSAANSNGNSSAGQDSGATERMSVGTWENCPLP